MSTLLLLNEAIPAHYKPNKRPTDANAGVLMSISDNSAAIFEAFNNLVDELASGEEWIENRAHTDGRYKVHNGRYQLSASTVYILEDSTQSFTVELKLSPKNHKPKELLLSYGNRAGDTGAHTAVIDIETLLVQPSEGMKEIINTAVEDLLVRIVPKEVVCRVMVLDPKFFNINHIQAKFLSAKDGAITNPEIVGFAVDNRNPMMFVGYEQQGTTGIDEIEIYEYLASLMEDN